nr:MAG TPA: Transcription factor S-II (TFIIS) [Caudoviricetes sp.]
MDNNVKFCSSCNETGINEMATAFVEGSRPFNFNKGMIRPYEIKSQNICPYCGNNLRDTGITDDDMDSLWDVSDSDRQFLEAMIELKKNDPIEYQLKMSQFKANLKQQEQVQESRTEENKPRCPTCGSTNIEKISLGKKAVGGALFGIFSSNVRKSMHCKSCGYKW